MNIMWCLPRSGLLCSFFLTIGLLLADALIARAQQEDTAQDQARQALEKVVSFYRTQVGFQGAYLWRYSSDLEYQEGEEIATSTSGWTQPPGTPAVGEAYLASWRASQNQQCLEAAVEAARALIKSQLRSGGWDSHFDLGPQGIEQYAYRQGGNSTGRNSTTFDDNKSQSALTLLMHVDEALQFQDAEIHEAVEYALAAMLSAQYPNGAWPQQYAKAVDRQAFPVLPASYPKEWSRTFPEKKYTEFYTLNDNNMAYIVDMLLEANRIYDRQDCYEAVVKTGEFFLLAQMPDPQPGWAQQYDQQMHPVWARKFEPPAITGGESQSVMKTLMTVYRVTGEKKFLAPVPIALKYYQSSKLANGQLARFYELETNRPLYFTKDYKLTYSDADMPTHYGFKVGARLEEIEAEYQRLVQSPAEDSKIAKKVAKSVRLTDDVVQRARRAIEALDERGAWVEMASMQHGPGPMQVIDMRTFIRNLEALGQLAGAK